jgi:glycerophosphoryl diester phosphodiesterase
MDANGVEIEQMNETQTRAAPLTRAALSGAGRRPLCYAHRGARSCAPENTLLAFAVAYDLGADGVECDLRRSRDGALVVMHDALVDRTTNGTGEVATMSLAELHSLDAGRHPRIPQRIPTVEETLALAYERNREINLEIKAGEAEEAIGTALAAVSILGEIEDAFRPRVLVSSYHFAALVELKRSLPWLRIALLYNMQWKGKDLIGPARKLGAEAIHPQSALASAELIRQAQASGLRVNVWTVNRRSTIHQFLDWGVDGLFSDYPERLGIERALHDTALGRSTPIPEP